MGASERDQVRALHADPLMIALRVWGLVSVRAYNALAKSAYLFRREGAPRAFEAIRLSHVAAVEPLDLFRIPNFGRQSLLEMRAVMARYGWSITLPPGFIFTRRQERSVGIDMERRWRELAIDHALIKADEERQNLASVARKLKLTPTAARHRLDQARTRRDRYPLPLPTPWSDTDSGGRIAAEAARAADAPPSLGPHDPLLEALGAWEVINTRTYCCLANTPLLFEASKGTGFIPFTHARLSHIAALDPRRLLDVRGFGLVSLFDVMGAMARYGMAFNAASAERFTDPAQLSDYEAYNRQRAVRGAQGRWNRLMINRTLMQMQDQDFDPMPFANEHDVPVWEVPARIAWARRTEPNRRRFPLPEVPMDDGLF